MQKRRRQREPGYTHPALRVPPLPATLAHIWWWFQEVASARTNNGFGPNPITFTDMLAWREAFGRPATREDMEALKEMDAVWLQVQAEAVPKVQ